MRNHKLLLAGLLVWYFLLSGWTAYRPVDQEFWFLSSILPAFVVAGLIVLRRTLPLSATSYVLIALFLSLHSIGGHYTYAQVPMGAWLDQFLQLGRNHFDRVVHFSFGFLLAYPIEEAFRLLAHVRGWVIYYLPAITILGLSGLWEIIEAWVTEAVHPELGITYLGSQGDIWDAQNDIAVAFFGSLLCMVLLLGSRFLRRVSSDSPLQSGTSVRHPS